MMVTTSPRKKIEILVDVPLLRRVRDMAESEGASGYTVLPTLGGEGHSGRWRDDQITGGAGSKVVFTTIMNADNADRLLTKLEPLLEDYSLLVMITTVDVIRSSKFN